MTKIPDAGNLFKDVHAAVLLYIHEHPGCARKDILRDLDITDRTWSDHRDRIGFNDAVYSYTGWYTTEYFERITLPRIYQQMWEVKKREAIEDLVEDALEGSAEKIIRAAQRYRLLCEAGPSAAYPIKNPPKQPPNRIELLMGG